MEILVGLAVVAILYFVFFRRSGMENDNNQNDLKNNSLSEEINAIEQSAHHHISNFVMAAVSSADPNLDDSKRQGVFDEALDALLESSQVSFPNPSKDALMALLLRSAVFDTISPMPPFKVFTGLRKQSEAKLREGATWTEEEINTFYKKVDDFASACAITATLGKPKYIDVPAFINEVINKPQ